MQKHLAMATKRKRIRERLYSMEDAVFYERSRTLAELFKRNVAAFTAFDFNLDMAYHAEWLAQILICEKHETDESANDELQQRTADMEEARKACFVAANGLMYYVEKAFPDNARIMQEFGFTERKNVRNKSLSTVVWIIVMMVIADDYNTELTAAGMPASVITDLDNAQLALVPKEIQQEVWKRKIVRLQRQRIEQVNTLYGYYQRVHRAAQVVFRKDEEVRKVFNLE